MNELPGLLLPATLETLQMVSISALLSTFGGLTLGLLLVVTAQGGVMPLPILHRILKILTNFGRSVPFIIIIVAIIPFTRMLVGTSIGTSAAIVPLVVGAIPYMARLVEGALLEVEPGVIEAVAAMGATPWQLVSKAYLPEALPALIRAITILTVTLISYSAMAGAIGGGGLGDLAIRYGYQRFRPDIMASTVAVTVILVQALQAAGDGLARCFDRR